MITPYTFEQLKEDVKKEAEALRVHATKEELEKLNIKELSPASPKGCIYGQMTGDCYSQRAAQLIDECTPIYVDRIYEAYENGKEGISRMDVVHQDPSFRGNRTSYGGMSARYSAIEAYIILPEAKNDNLIAFLKGETDALEL